MKIVGPALRRSERRQRGLSTARPRLGKGDEHQPYPRQLTTKHGVPGTNLFRVAPVCLLRYVKCTVLSVPRADLSVTIVDRDTARSRPLPTAPACALPTSGTVAAGTPSPSPPTIPTARRSP